jgi:hypothetical protein
MAEVLLAQVILFNRRRSGEAQRLKVKECTDAMKVADKRNVQDQEIVKSLSEFERKLFRSHCSVETRGKNGRRVPIILTDDMKNDLCTLLEHRDQTGMDSDFLFIKPGCRHPIRGCDVLRRFSR